MKIKNIFLIALGVGVVLLMGSTLETARYGWSIPRGAVSTDDTAHGATTSTYDDIPETAYKPTTGQNHVEITWTMRVDAQSCVVYVYAARPHGDIVLVWTATLTAGKQASTDSRYYVDTIASSTDNWLTPVKECDGSGADRMARIAFDTNGYAFFWCLYTGLSSESIKAYYSGL